MSQPPVPPGGPVEFQPKAFNKIKFGTVKRNEIECKFFVFPFLTFSLYDLSRMNGCHRDAALFKITIVALLIVSTNSSIQLTTNLAVAAP